jgi:hypothetical protein
MKTAAEDNKIKAYTVEDPDEGMGVIVFHYCASRAKALAFYYDDHLMDFAFVDLKVRRNKEADKFATKEPSVFDFQLHSKEYRELGWHCQDSSVCDWCGLGEYDDIPESIVSEYEDDMVCKECQDFEKSKGTAAEEKGIALKNTQLP